MKISAVIIAGDEEERIADAIRSVEFADEVLVIDSESTDRTREIAEESGARVIVRPWPGFSAQKQFGVEEAKYDWILSLDADETLTPALRTEIEEIGRVGPSADGYRIPRLAYYCGRPVRHCGWYPDRQLRFFDRRKGSWKDVLIHESVEMQPGSTVKYLKNDIEHFTIESAEQHRKMIETRYAPLAARQMFEDGRKASVISPAAAGVASFLSTYFLKLGILDGSTGYTIARMAAYHAWLKKKLLRELQFQVGRSRAA